MPNNAIRTVRLPAGDTVPALGQGTWYMGERPQARAAEIAALNLGIDLGMTLIDTAEMYGNGATETLVGEAIAGRRGEVYLVSKVLPSNASRRGTVRACEQSLRRLRTAHLDLYLLHWRGDVPLAETLSAFADLVRAGKIRNWGVSNFDLSDMQELLGLTGGGEVATNQVLYNPKRRGIEYDLLPMCRGSAIPVMAYSPVEQGRLLEHPAIVGVARNHGATPAQVALAWVLRHEHVIAIPKSASPAHLKENRTALDLKLTEQDYAVLDAAFPPPERAVPLAML